ncbi:MAG: AAA family ATPase [Flavisolibacter sp.]|nr:AAA family ATPase [Flavisolibacter sp.]
MINHPTTPQSAFDGANKDTILSDFPTEFMSHVNGLIESSSTDIGLLKVMPANDWIERAKTRPIPKDLYKQLWHEGEVCILFADTNLGKSILAVQIADHLSRTEKVLVADFELSDKQFEVRYSRDYTDHYKFNSNFFRIEINPEAMMPGGISFEDYLTQSLEQTITSTGAKILIIDNITYLRTETEKAKDALPLMKQLKALKNKYGLSILCLAHTPKRDLSKPITRNDLQGSKMLINFCDSCFAIGESTTDKALRYIKQIKARATEIIYDADNVAVYQVVKPGNFLHFEFINYGKESDHLRQQTDNDKEALTAKILDLKKSGKSLREIGTELGISHMKVNRLLKAAPPENL